MDDGGGKGQPAQAEGGAGDDGGDNKGGNGVGAKTEVDTFAAHNAGPPEFEVGDGVGDLKVDKRRCAGFDFRNKVGLFSGFYKSTVCVADVVGVVGHWY